MNSSAEQNRRRFATSPFTWRSQSAPNRDKWYRRGPLSRQRSRNESSGGESTQLLDHMVSRRLVSAIDVSLLQLSMSRAELNTVDRKEVHLGRKESNESSSPSLIGSKRPSQRGRVEQRRISTKIRKVPSIRPSTLCRVTKKEKECSQTISSQSSSSTSLSFICSSTTNDDSKNKHLEEEKITEKQNEVKNLKYQSNSIGRSKHREHSLIHQSTENNEKTSPPPTWTATFAQSLQIRSSSTRRRIRSPRPSAKHILILKHSVQLLEPKIQGIEYISANQQNNNNNNLLEKTNQSPNSKLNILTKKEKRRCFSVAKIDENRKQLNFNRRRRQFSYQSEDTDNEAIISDYNNNNNELLNINTSCSSGEFSETELDAIYNQERIHSKSCLSSPELSPDELKQLFPELSDHWRKALAKSPVVKRAAALQEQEQKRVTKHRTSRYWLEEQINPSEHIWLPSCSISSSTTVDTECYLGETDCGKIGEKRRCAACHIVAHTDCFPLLAKMNLNCKSTYRDCLTSNRRQNYKDGQDILYKHHWVHRWKLEGRCFHCGKLFQQKIFREKEVIAINCSWCKRSYHNKRSCFSLARFDDSCDRGILRELILPPTWLLRLSNQRKNKLTQQQKQQTLTSNISLKRNRKKYRPFIIKLIEQTQNNIGGLIPSLINTKEGNNCSSSSNCQQPPIQPLLAFVNPKSGGNKGAKALNTLCWLLNPRQVFDINTMHGPKYGLEIFRKMTNQMRILVCGGDGTVGWLLSTLDKLNWNIYPPIAILPLGTGNDLSRSMGWGGTFSDEPLTEILQSIQTETSITFLDRWRLDVFPILSNNNNQEQSTSNINLSSPSFLNEQQLNNNNEYKEHINNECQTNLPLSVMNNYFSIGADAHVALQFHHSRSANPQMLNSRLKNRLAYGGLGTIDLFKRAWKDLSEYITIECDGVDITSKIREFKFHCVLFHNISFYAGGTIPWGQGGDGIQEYCGEVFSRPSPCDGKIEVLGFTTATLATLQMGGRGERIAQCSNVRIETSKPIPMQVDGEPCLLGPSLIHLSFHNKVPMLKREKFARFSGSAPTNNIISMNANRRRKNSNQNNNNNNQINEQNNGLKTNISSPINNTNQHKNSKASLSSLAPSPPNNNNNICVSIVVVGRHDYDIYRDSVDRLKDTGFELGNLILEEELELCQVRERIQIMLSQHQILPYEPGKDWRFLDYVSNPEEGTFRISQQQEYCKTVADIISSLDETNSSIIILDDAFPSMTVRSAAIGHELVFNPAGVKQIKTSNEKNNLMRRRIGETLRIVLSTESQETHL